MNTPLDAKSDSSALKPRKRHWSRTGIGMSSIAALLVAMTASSAPAWADPDVDELEDELDSEYETLEGVVEDYNAARVELEETQEMIEELEETLAPYEEELDELYDRTSDFIVSVHINQGLGDIERLLDAGSPEALVERLTQMNAASMYDAALIDELIEVSGEYQDQLEELEILYEEVSEQETELDAQAENIEANIDDLQDDWSDAALSQGTEAGTPADYTPTYIAGDRGEVVTRALSNLGAPYGWGSSGPDAYDCSGLVLDAYREVGISLPHNAAAQYNQTTTISRDNLQAGDLVFYNGLEHMGMYIGDGYIVHSSTYGKPAQIVSIDHGNTWYGATTVF